MTKDHIFREVRKLISILNRFGNCLVPSIHKDGADTSAQERLEWIIKKAHDDYGLQVEDVQTGVNAL